MKRLCRHTRLLGAIALAIATVGVVEASPALRWEHGQDKLLVGEETTLHVMLDDSLRVRTFEVRVSFDPAVIASVSGGPGALFDGLDVYPGFDLTDGDQWHGYCVILGADDWAKGPGELFHWTVRALAEGTAPVVTVELGLLPPGGGDYPDAVLPDAILDVLDPTAASRCPPSSVPTLALFPNPFNPRTTVGSSWPPAPAADASRWSTCAGDGWPRRGGAPGRRGLY